MLQIRDDSHKPTGHCPSAPRAAVCFQGNASFLNSCTHLGFMPWVPPSIGIGSLCILPHEAPSWKSKFPSGVIIKGIHHEKSSVDEDASRCSIQSQGVVATFLTVTKCLASNTKDGARGRLYNYSMCASQEWGQNSASQRLTDRCGGLLQVCGPWAQSLLGWASSRE